MSYTMRIKWVRRIITLVILSLSIGELYAQASPITRRHLKQIISEGIHHTNDQFYTLLGCNEDSLYYTADTIHFYDNVQFFDQIGICCEFIEWEFTDGNLVRQQEPQTCLEPSSVEISTRRYFKYRMKKWGGNIYFQLMEQKKPVITYRLTNIEYLELADLMPCTAITLVRVKKSTPDESPKLPMLKKKRKAIRENPIMISMERKFMKLPNLHLIEKEATAKPILQKKVK